MTSLRNPLYLALLAGCGLFLFTTGDASAAHSGKRDVFVRGGVHHGTTIVRNDRHARGHYEVRHQRVLVKEGHYHKVWHPAVVETRYDSCGHPYTVTVRRGHYDRIWHPAQYETRAVRVWVPAPPQCVVHVPQREVVHVHHDHRHDRRYRSKKKGWFNVFLRF